MALSTYNIKKWYKMMRGKSVFHVNQNLGKYFEVDALKGYYNNMIEKVSYAPHLVESDEMPILHTESGGIFIFPVAVFQFAFGLLDFYYETNNVKYIKKLRQCADWAVKHQLTNGSWDNFSYIYPKNSFGAMAQGEGASLLLRSYKLFGDEKYLMAAQKAVYFLLKDVKDGGCTKYEGDDVILLEYQHLPVVLNGWIFSWWGLYDYVLVTHDRFVTSRMNESLNTLMRMMPKFACAFWSMYDLGGKIASPFYHNLHIAQMQAMYKLTGMEVFQKYAQVWKKQQNNKCYKALAFIKKAIQKIKEK